MKRASAILAPYQPRFLLQFFVITTTTLIDTILFIRISIIVKLPPATTSLANHIAAVKILLSLRSASSDSSSLATVFQTLLLFFLQLLVRLRMYDFEYFDRRGLGGFVAGVSILFVGADAESFDLGASAR